MSVIGELLAVKVLVLKIKRFANRCIVFTGKTYAGKIIIKRHRRFYRFYAFHRGISMYLRAINAKMPTAYKPYIYTLLDNSLHDFLKKSAFCPSILRSLFIVLRSGTLSSKDVL